MLTLGSTSIMVSWMPPSPYSPNYYNVSYSCQQIQTVMCITVETVKTTSQTVSNSSLAPGSSCTISVVAVYDGIGMSNTVSSTVNTTIQGIVKAN